MAETNQQEDVDGNPHQPRDEARQPEPAEIRNCGAAANRRHIAVVVITERLEPRACDRTKDVLGGMGPFLFGDLGDAGQRLAVLLECADVAGNEDGGMSWYRE